MDITQLTITELKALAFDMNNQLQQVSNNLQVILKELETKIKQESEPKNPEKEPDQEMRPEPEINLEKSE